MNLFYQKCPDNYTLFVDLNTGNENNEFGSGKRYFPVILSKRAIILRRERKKNNLPRKEKTNIKLHTRINFRNYNFNKKRKY